MSMKSYLRYIPESTFGIINSPQCNVVYDTSGNLILSGSGSSVLIYNARKSMIIGKIEAESENYPYILPGEVSLIAISPDKHTGSVGYSIGTIR